MRRLQKLKRTGSSKHGGHAQKHASPVYHTPNPQDRFNPSSASPDLPTVENGEGPVISASGIDSGCGKYIPARDATFGPFSTTPDQVSNAVGIPSLGNIYNSRNPAYPSPYQETYNEDVADDVEEAEIEVEDKEPGFDPAADLNYYAEDPKTGVIESRRRKGWGRTGMRNGVEVWFNPKTEEWRKL